MAVLIHDFYELEERAGKHLQAWKAWHIVIYAFAAVFGILNYVFLHNTMYMVDDHCLLQAPNIVLSTVTVNMTDVLSIVAYNPDHGDKNETEVGTNEAQTTAVPVNLTEMLANLNRDADIVENDTITSNGSIEQPVLDLIKTFFGPRQNCEFAEYMPILSSVFALVWTTLFVMCPSGGHARFGLAQPWRILAPALVFALVLVGLTGSSFTQTNRGLREFCSAFYNYTNATTKQSLEQTKAMESSTEVVDENESKSDKSLDSCSSVDVYMERSWNATWRFSGRAAATRAASAAVWVCWACAATLLIVRCLAAPDFQLMRTGVYLAKDPEQKLTPHLLKSRRRGQTPSPNKSVRSEPTATTELVPSMEQDSAPTSRLGTPVHGENVSRV